MECTRKITNDITWVGANERRASLFEGVYAIPSGVSYNSYLINDDVTVLMDTVDKSVREQFFSNLEFALDSKKLDYIVIQHMEPDHTAVLSDVLVHYPNAKIVCNQKTVELLGQFFDAPDESRLLLMKEGDFLSTGHHKLTFFMAPMVHWPEVMVTYDETEKILFSADAFGTFGALNGAIFADEVDFFRDYLDEARRYYCNIVGKYGVQAQALLNKASKLEIKKICPLHGFVWRENISSYIEKYNLWSSYQPEENGVMIAYASVYGNTAAAAEALSIRLFEKGIKTVMFDVSVSSADTIIAASFKWSTLVFASTTYNGGVFVKMDELLRDLAAHNIQKRTVAFIENGSWAPLSARKMREILEPCKDMEFIEASVKIRSALKTYDEINALASEIATKF